MTLRYLVAEILLLISSLTLVKSQEACTSMCDASYPLHTLDKVSDLQACTKGCRLQYISHLSRTKSNCVQDCTQAYGKSLSERKACQEGCEEQKALELKPKMLQVEETSDLTFHFRLLHPIFVARNYYYTLFNKEDGDEGGRRSNSFYFAEQSSSDGKGNSIFLRLEMHPLKIGKYRTFDSVDSEEGETEETVETHKSETTVNNEGSSFKHYVKHIHGKASRWLNCVEMKAGVPYTTLVAILFMSIAMVAWVCCSTCDEMEDEEEEEEEVGGVKRHKFSSSKGGLSIMADKLQIEDSSGDIKIFTISSSKENKEDPDDDRLLQI